MVDVVVLLMALVGAAAGLSCLFPGKEKSGSFSVLIFVSISALRLGVGIPGMAKVEEPMILLNPGRPFGGLLSFVLGIFVTVHPEPVFG